MDPQLKSLFEATTRPFIPAGRYAWHFARGKLSRDPVFFALLRRGLLPDQGHLYDLGCGQGILLALLAAAKLGHRAGHWPRGWPPPPSRLEMHGVELREDRVRTACAALNGAATVALGDIRETPIPACSAIVILDVLLYLDQATQRQLLRRIAAALEPGGVLLLREADAGAGLAFQATQWAERLAGAARGRLWQKLHYRRRDEWIALLEELGFAVSAEPMSEGTPFSNALFVARRPTASADLGQAAASLDLSAG